MPSPCSTVVEPDYRMLPRQNLPAPAIDMLKIRSLLNPPTSDHSIMPEASVTPPPTPAYTTQGSSSATTPQPQTPTTPSTTKRQKLVKDGAVFIPGTAKEPVNYPPYECTERALCLSLADQEVLAHQHARFELYPRGCDGQGFIADFQRRIPYSSERREFHGKTNRDAFEGKSTVDANPQGLKLMFVAVFTYTFRVPGDSDKKHVVMWDYQNGLVRITPFFKALSLSKVSPHLDLHKGSF